MSNDKATRRGFVLGAGAAALTLAGCNTPSVRDMTTPNPTVIDRRVDATEQFLFTRYPAVRDLAAKASGILYMPLITKGGFGVGGSYGVGALRVGGLTADYFSAAQATFGMQIGVQQYAHALFFMTPGALERFRASSGVSFGANVEYALRDQGGNLNADVLTATSPVIALVFGQAGLILGATLEGTKYTRLAL